MFQKSILFFIIACVLQLSMSFLAYDCDRKDIFIKRISAVSTPICIYAKKNITKETISIQLVQPKSMDVINVFRCYISHQHFLYRCGKTIDQPQSAGLYSEFESVSEQECLEMHRKNRFFVKKASGEMIPINLTPNGITKFSYTSIGSISDGSCDGEQNIKINGIDYKRAIRLTETTIQISQEKARIDLTSKKLIMPNGNQFEYFLGEESSADYGNLFWSTDVSSNKCPNDQTQYVVLYEGLATKVKEIDQNEIESLSYYFHIQDYEVQLYLSNMITVICGMQGLRTEHPKLVIIEKIQNFNFVLPYQQLSALDVNIITYFNTKITHVTRHIKSQIDNLFDLLSYERCKTENKITHNLLTLSQISPLEFAFDYMQSPGYTAVTLGEVIYISQCKPVDVMYHHITGNCYKELPVVMNGTIMFMQPRTKVLTDIGTKITCVPGINPAYMIMNEWYTPGEYGLININSPDIIHPSSLNYTFKIINQLSSGGIYTQDALDKIHQLLMTPLKEQIIKSSMTQALNGNGDLPGGYYLSNAFKQYDFKSIENKFANTWDKIKNRLSTAGSWFSLIIGIIVILRCIKFILNTIINSFILKQEYGFNWLLIFACWENIVHLLLRNKDKKDRDDLLDYHILSATGKEIV